MRRLINIIEAHSDTHKVGDMVAMSELYSNSELMDESELLYNFLSPKDYDTPVVVRSATPDFLRELTGRNPDMGVEEEFDAYASQSQRRYVEKMMNDLTGEIVVVYGDQAVDGFHRIVAAIKSNTPLMYVDLKDLD